MLNFSEETKAKIRYLAAQILGVVFLILGVIGLALPFLQGFLFLAIGAVLISLYNPRIHRALHRHIHKYRRIKKTVEKLERGIEKIFGKPPEHQVGEPLG